MKVRTKYIKRPPSKPIVYRCDECSVTITMYVENADLQHRCLKTRRWSKLKS